MAKPGFGLMITVDDVETGSVPLTSITINAHILDSVAEMCIKQIYFNKTDDPVDIVFKYPLEESATVCGFRAEVDDRIIEGVVRETEEDDYDDAFQSGHAAFFLQETLPEVFKAKIGVLSPNSSAKVTFTYFTLLKFEDGLIVFHLPKLVAKSDENIHVEFKAEVQAASQIKEICSPTHKITVTQDQPHRSLVRLQDKASLMDQDLTLNIHLSNPHNFHLVFEKSNLGSTALMCSLSPWCSLKAAEQKLECILLVDRSGSMEGLGIRKTRQALKVFLHSLPSDCYINVVSFGFQHSALFPSSRTYDDQVLSETGAHIDAMEANMGGTEIFGPLEWIFHQKPVPGYLRSIFLLTDGEVSNEDQVISLVRRNNHQARVFSLGLGNGVSRHLVEGIARAGHGTAMFASLGEHFETKLLEQLREALKPTLTDVNIVWEGYEMQPSDRLKWRQIPTRNPPVFEGQHLLAFGLLEEGSNPPNSVTLNALSPLGPVSIQSTLKDSNFSAGRLVHRLAAKKLIQELQDQEATDDVMKEIIDLGCRYGLASRYTSYVAVEPQKPDDLLKQSWIMIKSRDVPNTMAFRCDGCPPHVQSDEPTPDGITRQDEKLMDLISMQKADGSFALDGKLALLLSTTTDEILLVGRDGGYDEPTWTTLVALAFLSLVLSELQSSWTLLASKSDNWLRSQSLPDQLQAKQVAKDFIASKLNMSPI